MTDSLSGRGPVKRDFEVPTPAGPARVDVVYADAAAAL
ncbi:MAG: hypothetical protein QOG49_1591, partial [Frankiaceae bacterium]|nr:hypothetical protein [Frankiaceae bacterium]